MKVALAILLLPIEALAQLFQIGPLISTQQDSSGAAAISYPLDLTTNTEFSAFSPARQLKAGWTNAGFTVRRVSDSTTNDILFVNGVDDRASLLSFAGTNSCTIARLYDQTGNGRHLESSTGPVVVTNGVAITNNAGRLAVKWDGLDDLLSSASGGWTLPVSQFLVARLDAFTMNDIMTAGNGTINNAIKSGSTGGIRLNAGAILAWGGTALVATNFYLIDTYTETGTNDFINVNNGTATTGTAGDTATSSTLTWGSATICPEMTCSEWMIFTGLMSAGERTMILTNTMTFYGIP